MAYYCFDRCPEECVPKLETLVKELGLIEAEDCLPGYRQWSGSVFDRKEEFDGRLFVIYSENKGGSLRLQTSPKTTHKQEDVKSLVNKFITIAQPTAIKNPFEPYDLTEFD